MTEYHKTEGEALPILIQRNAKEQAGMPLGFLKALIRAGLGRGVFLNGDSVQEYSDKVFPGCKTNGITSPAQDPKHQAENIGIFNGTRHLTDKCLGCEAGLHCSGRKTTSKIGPN